MMMTMMMMMMMNTDKVNVVVWLKLPLKCYHNNVSVTILSTHSNAIVTPNIQHLFQVVHLQMYLKSILCKYNLNIQDRPNCYQGSLFC